MAAVVDALLNRAASDRSAMTTDGDARPGEGA